MWNGEGRNGEGQRGFGYLLLLFALAAVGLLLAGAGQVWHSAAQREKETELLFVGGQFANAIASYYERTPGAAKQYPAQLADLLEDRRWPVPLRHLRKLYRDPLTGDPEWGLVRVGGRIVGVHSRSAARPFRTAFQGRYGRYAAFAGALRYDQWVFRAEVAEDVPASAAGVAGAAPGSPFVPAPAAVNDPWESHPCVVAYLAEIRLCDENATGIKGQLLGCHAAVGEHYLACRRGG